MIRDRLKFWFSISGMGIIMLIVLAYGIFATRGLVKESQIIINSPDKDTLLAKNPVTISGNAENSAHLLINGKQVLTDENGNFSKDILLVPGKNLVEINSKDRFNRKKIEILSLYYDPKSPLPDPPKRNLKEEILSEEDIEDNLEENL